MNLGYINVEMRIIFLSRNVKCLLTNTISGFKCADMLDAIAWDILDGGPQLCDAVPREHLGVLSHILHIVLSVCNHQIRVCLCFKEHQIHCTFCGQLLVDGQVVV